MQDCTYTYTKIVSMTHPWLWPSTDQVSGLARPSPGINNHRKSSATPSRCGIHRAARPSGEGKECALTSQMLLQLTRCGLQALHNSYTSPTSAVHNLAPPFCDKQIYLPSHIQHSHFFKTWQVSCLPPLRGPHAAYEFCHSRLGNVESSGTDAPV
jgi:hypothetical protein